MTDRHPAPDAVLDRLAAAVTDLRRRVDAIEAGRRLRHADDAAALRALAVAADGATWTATTMHRRATVDAALAAALADVDVTTAAELGAWCRTMRDVDAGGLRLVRGRRTGAGYTWAVVQMCMSTYTAGASA